MRQSVYCLASDNICSLIEHWFYSGSLSCHINLTPCVLLSGESTISPKFGSMLRPGRITVLFFSPFTRTSAMRWQVWFDRSGHWPHRFTHSARCNFHVQQLQRGGEIPFLQVSASLLCWWEESSLERVWCNLPKQTRRNPMSVPLPSLWGSTRSSLKFLWYTWLAAHC